MTDYDVRASAGKGPQVISQVECEELGSKSQMDLIIQGSSFPTS